MNNTRDTMRQLRRKISGSDTFMSGHQINKIRGRQRLVPMWTKDDSEVAQLLVKVFPKLKTSPVHRARAARWTRIIHLYFRMQFSRGRVATEMKTTYDIIRYTLDRIMRAKKGLSTNGSVRKKLGRPRKLSA